MITIQLKDDEVSAGLAAIAARLPDLTPLMEELGEILLDSTKRRFVEGAAPDGTAWAPKTATTMGAYRRRGDRADPRPLIGPSGRLSAQILSFPGPASIEIGSNALYAAVQQFGQPKGASGATRTGRPIPWGNIPARPFVGLSARDRAAVMDAIGDWLTGTAGV